MYALSIQGYESTSTALQFLLFCLALNPKHQEICRKEIDEILDIRKTCSNDNFTIHDMDRMKHLERCIYETLRLYPSAVMYLRKLEEPLRIGNSLSIVFLLKKNQFIEMIFFCRQKDRTTCRYKCRGIPAWSSSRPNLFYQPEIL